jgi:hypothetical protein
MAQVLILHATECIFVWLASVVVSADAFVRVCKKLIMQLGSREKARAVSHGLLGVVFESCSYLLCFL